MHQGRCDKNVYCDCCPDEENLAVKTCLKCEVSLCNEHLRHHLERPAFAHHTLVKPLLEILKRKCPVHKDEVARYYCKESMSYACNLCKMEGMQLNGNKLVSSIIRNQLSVRFSPGLISESVLECIGLDLKAGGGRNKIFL